MATAWRALYSGLTAGGEGDRTLGPEYIGIRIGPIRSGVPLLRSAIGVAIVRRRWIPILAALVVLGGARQAAAQGFVSPFIGYNFGGDAGSIAAVFKF